MIITIDVGNTNTKFTCFAGGEQLYDAAVPTNKNDNAQTFFETLQRIVKNFGLGLNAIDGLSVSCVVADLVEPIRQAAELASASAGHKVNCFFLTPESASSLEHKIYDVSFPHPEQVGPDYIAAVIGAKTLTNGACIMCDMGTATNFAILNESGSFYAGVIYPGVETAANAMFGNASALNSFNFINPGPVAGRNTNECIASGLIYGEAARIDGLIDRIWQEQGYKSKVILTGGWAETIAPHVQHKNRVETGLLALGLKVFYETQI